jgi:hypothetical protein
MWGFIRVTHIRRVQEARLAWISVLLIARVAFADPVWLGEFEDRLAVPAKAKDTVAWLAALPLEERQSADFHWAMARACQAADKAGPSAEAVALYSILPARPRRDLEPVKAWLAKKGEESFAMARTAQASGDMKTAVKRFLVAVKCNPSLLGEDDRGLRDMASGALGRLCDRNPTRPDYRYHLGFYGNLFGETPTAVEAYQAVVQMETDPYKKWRAQTWLGSFLREKAEEKRLANAALAKAKTAAPPRKDSDPTGDLRKSEPAPRGKASDEKVADVAEHKVK